MKTLEDICEDVLEALQHSGGWMTLAEIQVATRERSSSAVYEALQYLVRTACVSARRSWGADGQAYWHAVMEDER